MVTAEDDSATDVHPEVGVLLVRAWVEPGTATVRARLLTTEDDGPVPTTWATAAGADAICEEFRRWVRHLQDRAGPARAGPDEAPEG